MVTALWISKETFILVNLTMMTLSADACLSILMCRRTGRYKELNRKLLLKRQKQLDRMHFAFETEDLLRCTKTEMAQYYRDMINNGVMSVNEVRRKLDFEPVNGGDEHYIQLNMATLTTVAQNKPNNE